MVYILPFIEQDAIYRKWQFVGNSGAFNTNNNNLANGAVIPTLICPSSPLPTEPATRQLSANGKTIATGNYVGISGAVHTIPGFTETRYNILPSAGEVSAGGILIPNGQLTLASISDGTSNTMAISEHSNFLTDTSGVHQDWRATQPWGWILGVKSPGVPPNFDNSGGDNREPGLTTIRYTINYAPAAGWANDITGTGVGVGSYTADCVGANIPLNSTHSGGVNVVYCDGSVHVRRQCYPPERPRHPGHARRRPGDPGLLINPACPRRRKTCAESLPCLRSCWPSESSAAARPGRRWFPSAARSPSTASR